MPSPVSAPHFYELKACFVLLGSRLSAAQLLELADLYHDLIRVRRTLAGHELRQARPSRTLVSTGGK